MQYMHDNLWIHIVCCCRFVDGGASTSAKFKPRHTSINWVLPWGMKHLFFLETKGLQGRWIDWLVWRFTTMVARHYMHIAKMKKRGFIRNKVVECIVKMSVEKATLILHTNVTHGIDDSNKTSHAWMVQNQQHLNMTYKVPLPFI